MDQSSRDTFRQGAPGNAFCGVMDVNSGKIYLNPLVPEPGKSTPYPAGTQPTVGHVNGGLVPAPPIEHTNVNVRNAGGGGRASHDQLIERIGGDIGNFVGFSAYKGENGGVDRLNFKSRTLNNDKFNTADPSPLRRNQPISYDGLMGENAASSLLGAMTAQLGSR